MTPPHQQLELELELEPEQKMELLLRLELQLELKLKQESTVVQMAWPGQPSLCSLLGPHCPGSSGYSPHPSRLKVNDNVNKLRRSTDRPT